MRTADRAASINYGAELILIAAATFVLTYFSIDLFREVGRTSTFWPANAVMLSALLRSDTRRWAGLMAVGLAAMVAGYMAGPSLSWLGQASLISNLGLPACNGINVLICAFGMRRAFGREIDLTRGRQLLPFMLLVGVIAPLVSGALSVGVLTLSRRWSGLAGQPLASFFNLYMSRALGQLILTPVLLAATPRRLADLIAARRAWRGVGLFALLAGALAIVFLQSRLPLHFVIIPIVMLITYQLELAGGALAVLLTAIVAVFWSAVAGGGPAEVQAGLAGRAILAQLFLAVNTLSMLATAAFLADQKRLSAESRESEARYRLLADRVTDVIVRYDMTGTIVYVSPSVGQFGYQPQALIGHRATEFIHPDDLPGRRGFGKALITGAPLPQGELNQFRLLRADGGYVWLESSPSRIFDDAGRPVGVVAVQRDVTSRRLMMEELERKRAEAEAATRAKSEFLANMSHEIRTPLTGILGFGALLKKVPGLPADATTYVNRIATAGETLLSVVNDVLDFSKIDAGQIALDPHPFEPAAFLAETVALVSSQATEKGLVLTTRLQESMPQAVFADSARLRQVLLNLLVNAVKFTDQGGVTATLSYEASSGGRLRFEVKDTGIGIDPDLSHRLFQRFSQVDGSTTRLFGGTGLGLAISKGLVELMGGQIGVESQIGRGSTFWFTVSAAPAALAVAEPAAQSFELQPGALRLLLVDDVAMNRELVSAILSPFDVHVTEAASGAEAVEASMREAFDLILMDLQMPGMDGMAATRAIRNNSELNKGVPILALSANVLPEQIAACRLAGLNDHIAKPVNPGELLSKIAIWTEPHNDDLAV